MDLVTILFVTAAVLGVLLVVLAVIGVVVLLPPVRRALRERPDAAAASEHAEATERSEAAEQQP